MKKFTLTSEQVQAARMLLRWKQTDLAAKSGMSLPTIKRIELIPGEFGAQETTIAAIRKAFEREGIRFFSGTFLGVRLRKREESSTDPRKSTPAVSVPAPGAKPVKTIKKAAKKARWPHPKGLK